MQSLILRKVSLNRKKKCIFNTLCVLVNSPVEKILKNLLKHFTTKHNDYNHRKKCIFNTLRVLVKFTRRRNILKHFTTKQSYHFLISKFDFIYEHATWSETG